MKFFLKRLAVVPIAVGGVVLVSFLLVAVIPSDIPRLIVGPVASKAQLNHIAEQLHLNQPLQVRFWDYIVALAHGNLGRSFFTGQPVASAMESHLASTIGLIVPALFLAVLIGLSLGLLGALFQRRRPGTVARMILTALQSTPDFLLALLLIIVFFSELHILPGPEGQLSVGMTAPHTVTGIIWLDALLTGNWSAFADAIQHLILPAVTLGLSYSVVFGKTTQAALGVALDSGYSQFGTAMGLSRRRVVLNALIVARTSLLTYGAIIIAGLIGGDAIIELIFSWNGIGQWALQGIQQSDIPVVQGFTLVSGLITIGIYLVLDLVSNHLDPRIGFGKDS